MPLLSKQRPAAAAIYDSHVGSAAAHDSLLRYRRSPDSSPAQHHSASTGSSHLARAVDKRQLPPVLSDGLGDEVADAGASALTGRASSAGLSLSSAGAGRGGSSALRTQLDALRRLLAEDDDDDDDAGGGGGNHGDNDGSCHVPASTGAASLPPPSPPARSPGVCPSVANAASADDRHDWRALAAIDAAMLNATKSSEAAAITLKPPGGGSGGGAYDTGALKLLPSPSQSRRVESRPQGPIEAGPPPGRVPAVLSPEPQRQLEPPPPPPPPEPIEQGAAAAAATPAQPRGGRGQEDPALRRRGPLRSATSSGRRTPVRTSPPRSAAASTASVSPRGGGGGGGGGGGHISPLRTVSSKRMVHASPPPRRPDLHPQPEPEPEPPEDARRGGALGRCVSGASASSPRRSPSPTSSTPGAVRDMSPSPSQPLPRRAASVTSPRSAGIDVGGSGRRSPAAAQEGKQPLGYSGGHPPSALAACLSPKSERSPGSLFCGKAAKAKAPAAAPPAKVNATLRSAAGRRHVTRSVPASHGGNGGGGGAGAGARRRSARRSQRTVRQQQVAAAEEQGEDEDQQQDEESVPASASVSRSRPRSRSPRGARRRAGSSPRRRQQQQHRHSGDLLMAAQRRLAQLQQAEQTEAEALRRLADAMRASDSTSDERQRLVRKLRSLTSQPAPHGPG
jgi:hypothetical protein